jgi:hypothetical protein
MKWNQQQGLLPLLNFTRTALGPLFGQEAQRAVLTPVIKNYIEQLAHYLEPRRAFV